jgi:hypothetical protein
MTRDPPNGTDCSSATGGAEPSAGAGPAGPIAWAAGLVAVFPIAYAGAPFFLRDSIPLCPFRCATGQPCPFCGLTRAFAAATHLQWHDAFILNPVWPLAVAVILMFAVMNAIDACTGRKLAVSTARLAWSQWLWIMLALAVFDIWRIEFFAR